MMQWITQTLQILSSLISALLWVQSITGEGKFITYVFLHNNFPQTENKALTFVTEPSFNKLLNFLLQVNCIK